MHISGMKAFLRVKEASSMRQRNSCQGGKTVGELLQVIATIGNIKF